MASQNRKEDGEMATTILFTIERRLLRRYASPGAFHRQAPGRIPFGKTRNGTSQHSNASPCKKDGKLLQIERANVSIDTIPIERLG